MGTHFFLVNTSTSATYFWSEMATPDPVITSASQLVGQKIILPFGSVLSTLLKFHRTKYLPWSWETRGGGSIKGRGMLSYCRTFMISDKGHHPSFMFRNSFFFGSTHTALSLSWTADMDMDEAIREKMAQAVQIWRKQERKEDKKL